MKRVAAVAVMVAWFCCGAVAQRGGHGGGFSGSHGGFAGPAGGFAGHASPGFNGAGAFHGGFPAAPRSGFARPAPPRYMGPGYRGPGASSYPVRGMRPVSTGPRMPYAGGMRPVGGPGMPYASGMRPAGGPTMPSNSMHRAPYSPNGANHNNGYHNHNHVVIVSRVWPYWGYRYPFYGYYGYPYIWPSIFNDSDSYDSQPGSYYSAPQQPDYNYGPYQAQPPDDQPESAPQSAPPVTYPQQEAPPQQPNTSRRAPYGGTHSAVPEGAPPVTVVFKDGRPPEQIYNYMLTAKTLTVLDEQRRDIPVSQIDLEATAVASAKAGAEFSVPGGAR